MEEIHIDPSNPASCLSNAGIPRKQADQYGSLHSSVQTFGAIGLLEARGGDIVLRGREGERDHIIQLEKAVEKYDHTMELVMRYAKFGVRGWDTLKDIADDLAGKIREAVSQRLKENREVPADALKFAGLSEKG